MDVDKIVLGQRLAHVRVELGYSKRPAFSGLLGIPADTLGSYERGIRAPEMGLLATYHERFGVNLNWIVTGEGDMFDDLSKVPSAPIAVEPTTVQQLADTVGILSQNLDNMAQRLEPPPPPPTTIQFLRIEASAGGGAVVLSEDAIDLDMDAVALDLLGLQPRHMAALQVRGDSMEPTLRGGDIVIIDRSQPMPDSDRRKGQVYVVTIDGEVYIKRAAYDDREGFSWKSDNPVYPPLDDGDGTVLGKVVWLWRRVS